VSVLERDVAKKPKAGDPCPTCRDTLAGTLVAHCSHDPFPKAGSKPTEAGHVDDALNAGKSHGCAWLRCSECRRFGVPNTTAWVGGPNAQEGS
jgi:hypothetical protein